MAELSPRVHAGRLRPRSPHSQGVTLLIPFSFSRRLVRCFLYRLARLGQAPTVEASLIAGVWIEQIVARLLSVGGNFVEGGWRLLPDDAGAEIALVGPAAAILEVMLGR